MLGLGDLGVTLALLATLGSAALCVVYGLVHRNDHDDDDLDRRRP